MTSGAGGAKPQVLHDSVVVKSLGPYYTSPPVDSKSHADEAKELNELDAGTREAASNTLKLPRRSRR